MNFRRTVEAVIPGVQGRILAVLSEVSTELNLRTIARLSDVSPAQASRVLARLVDLGIVERRDVAPSMLFRLVSENVASQAVLALARAGDLVLAELGRTAGELRPAPVSVIVFGSFARGEAIAESDLDVLLVRPDSAAADDEEWASSVERWRQQAARLTGNRVEVIEVGEAEAARLLDSARPLWEDVRRDGVVVTGRPLAELGAP
jgi:predicted nucleotidyltransferase